MHKAGPFDFDGGDAFPVAGTALFWRYIAYACI